MGAGGPVAPVIPPAPPADIGLHPGGGVPHDYVPTRRDVSRARKRFGLDDGFEVPARAGAIIADVAARQAERLELDEQKIFEELLRELEIEGLEFDRRYLEALNRQRELLIDEEIAQQFRRIQEEEELLMLMLIAGAAIR